MSTLEATAIDVRTIAPRLRHQLIFSSFDGLPVGAALELVVDHDPLPLHHQFQLRAQGQFDWAYRMRGPDEWRVRIGRVAAKPAHGSGSCCGACGGR